MAVLLVTYELKSKFKDYSDLFKAIQSNCLQWWHYIENSWVVSTTDSANELANKLYPHIENTDHLLVVKIGREHQGWLPQGAWDWLNSKLY